MKMSQTDSECGRFEFQQELARDDITLTLKSHSICFNFHMAEMFGLSSIYLSGYT